MRGPRWPTTSLRFLLPAVVITLFVTITSPHEICYSDGWAGMNHVIQMHVALLQTCRSAGAPVRLWRGGGGSLAHNGSRPIAGIHIFCRVTSLQSTALTAV